VRHGGEDGELGIARLQRRRRRRERRWRAALEASANSSDVDGPRERLAVVLLELEVRAILRGHDIGEVGGLEALSLEARRLHGAKAVFERMLSFNPQTSRAFASVGTTSGTVGRGRRCRRRRTRSEYHAGRVCTDDVNDRADVRGQHRRGPHVLLCQRWRSW